LNGASHTLSNAFSYSALDALADADENSAYQSFGYARGHTAGNSFPDTCADTGKHAVPDAFPYGGNENGLRTRRCRGW
jgi:hypothetical protein